MSTYEEWAEGIDALPVPEYADDIPAVSLGSDGDVRVTVRLSAEERADMIDFMRRHGRTNVSEFVREAIAWAIRTDMGGDDDLMALLRESGPMTARQAAEELGMDRKHVRRKLNTLHAAGLLRKVGTYTERNAPATLWGVSR